jgi:hypothetical protein
VSFFSPPTDTISCKRGRCIDKTTERSGTRKRTMHKRAGSIMFVAVVLKER